MSGVADAAHIKHVLAAYGHAPGAASVEAIAGGLINRTYCVRDAAGEPIAVLQRLHQVFGAEVNEDIDAVTAHLAAAGLTTPRLIRTRSGAGSVARGGGVWRMLSWMDGTTVHAVGSAEQAASAAELVARFHRALENLGHTFVHVRAGVHDTAAHLTALAERIAAEPGGAESWHAGARALGREILAAAATLPDLADLPRRVCHGDLKISNVLFAPGQPQRARCLVDLDTLGMQTIAYELGDAMRSWCNPSGEDLAAPAVDATILEAAMGGYGRGAPGLLSPGEIASIIPGLETVCVELAARFCVDVFDDCYFGWNKERFSSRRDHNLLRARGQLALARSVTSQRDRLAEIVRTALA